MPMEFDWSNDFEISFFQYLLIFFRSDPIVDQCSVDSIPIDEIYQDETDENLFDVQQIEDDQYDSVESNEFSYSNMIHAETEEENGSE